MQFQPGNLSTIRFQLDAFAIGLKRGGRGNWKGSYFMNHRDKHCIETSLFEKKTPALSVAYSNMARRQNISGWQPQILVLPEKTDRPEKSDRCCQPSTLGEAC
jgi:hypothetical protein